MTWKFVRKLLGWRPLAWVPIGVVFFPVHAPLFLMPLHASPFDEPELFITFPLSILPAFLSLFTWIAFPRRQLFRTYATFPVTRRALGTSMWVTLTTTAVAGIVIHWTYMLAWHFSRPVEPQARIGIAVANAAVCLIICHGVWLLIYWFQRNVQASTQQNWLSRRENWLWFANAGIVVVVLSRAVALANAHQYSAALTLILGLATLLAGATFLTREKAAIATLSVRSGIGVGTISRKRGSTPVIQARRQAPIKTAMPWTFYKQTLLWALLCSGALVLAFGVGPTLTDPDEKDMFLSFSTTFLSVLSINPTMFVVSRALQTQPLRALRTMPISSPRLTLWFFGLPVVMCAVISLTFTILCAAETQQWDKLPLILELQIFALGAFELALALGFVWSQKKSLFFCLLPVLAVYFLAGFSYRKAYLPHSLYLEILDIPLLLLGLILMHRVITRSSFAYRKKP